MGTSQCSEVCFWFIVELSLNCAFFCCQISGCEQPCKFSSNNHRYGISINAYFISCDSRVGAPEWKSRNMFTHIVELTQRTRPVASCSGFRGSWLESSCRHTPSMRRTTVVVLHSTDCFHLSLFSCLAVDKLLLVLLLLRCKVLPMGTLICHDRPAWVVRPNLLPRKIVDKLDYYGSFVSFTGIA
jgi:hypothetical protein